MVAARVLEKRREPILGAVGQLQFDVVEARFLQEYSVKVISSPLPYVCARWPKATLEEIRKIRGISGTGIVLATDQNGRVACLFSSNWDMKRLVENNPTVEFQATG